MDGIVSGKITQVEDVSYACKIVKDSVDKLRKDGNALYKSRKYQKALEKYTLAIDFSLSPPDNLKRSDSIVDSFVRPMPIPVDSKLHSNRAQCYLKLGLFDNVIAECNAALDIDCKNSKAIWLRSQGFYKCGNLEQAFSDLTSLQNDSFNEIDLAQIENDIDTVKRALDDKLRKMRANEHQMGFLHIWNEMLTLSGSDSAIDLFLKYVTDPEIIPYFSDIFEDFLASHNWIQNYGLVLHMLVCFEKIHLDDKKSKISNSIFTRLAESDPTTFNPRDLLQMASFDCISIALTERSSWNAWFGKVLEKALLSNPTAYHFFESHVLNYGANILRLWNMSTHAVKNCIILDWPQQKPHVCRLLFALSVCQWLSSHDIQQIFQILYLDMLKCEFDIQEMILASAFNFIKNNNMEQRMLILAAAVILEDSIFEIHQGLSIKILFVVGAKLSSNLYELKLSPKRFKALFDLLSQENSTNDISAIVGLVARLLQQSPTVAEQWRVMGGCALLSNLLNKAPKTDGKLIGNIANCIANCVETASHALEFVQMGVQNKLILFIRGMDPDSKRNLGICIAKLCICGMQF
jgi:tetratricopeptide (TPR) repeat protein